MTELLAAIYAAGPGWLVAALVAAAVLIAASAFALGYGIAPRERIVRIVDPLATDDDKLPGAEAVSARTIELETAVSYWSTRAETAELAVVELEEQRDGLEERNRTLAEKLAKVDGLRAQYLKRARRAERGSTR